MGLSFVLFYRFPNVNYIYMKKKTRTYNLQQHDKNVHTLYTKLEYMLNTKCHSFHYFPPVY